MLIQFSSNVAVKQIALNEKFHRRIKKYFHIEILDAS